MRTRIPEDPTARIALSERLTKLEDKHPPIPLGSVDYTFKNPDALRADFADILRYFARVERDVEGNVIQFATLFPRADENLQRFLKIWESQEVPHGFIFEEVQRVLELTPDEPNLDYVSPNIRVGGALANIPQFHDVMEMVYFATGSMHERATADGYVRLDKKLRAIGEVAFADTGIKQILPQEGGHYAYYRESALAKREQLSPWQLRMARLILRQTYTPVGANSEQQKADFGRTIQDLSGGNSEPIDIVKAKIKKVHAELMADTEQGLAVPIRFVDDAFEQCIDLSNQREAA